MVHVDLEFNDGNGAVLLPVTSQVVLIDSRDENPAARPFRQLELKQVLDDRGLAEGTLRLEVEATAKGLIPDLGELLDMANGAPAGFALAKTEDLGLEVASLDTTGDQVEPVCHRRWLLDLVSAGDSAATQFRFPPPADSAVAMAYQRYDDADLVDTTAVVPLRSFVLPRRTWWWLAGLLAGAALIGLVAVVAVRFRRRTRQVAGPAYRQPDPLTPFNLVVLLKKIHGDQQLGLATQEQDDLAGTIGRLEQHFFGPNGQPDEAAVPDLATLAGRWLARASHNGSAATAEKASSRPQLDRPRLALARLTAGPSGRASSAARRGPPDPAATADRRSPHEDRAGRPSVAGSAGPGPEKGVRNRFENGS